MGPVRMLSSILIFAVMCDVTSSNVRKSDQIDDCRGKAADIVFVLDASNSIWDVDFKRQLSFVNNIVDLFHIGSRNQKVSVVTYSDHPQLQFPFYAYNLKSDVKAAVSSIRQTGGHDTKTDEALEYIRKYSFSADHGARLAYWVNKIGIIVTDGDSRNATATEIQAQLARDSGIHLFAIGVGSEVRNEELEIIASKPTEYYTFRVNDFKSMDTIKNFLAIKTCAATNPTTTRRTTTITTTTTTIKPTTTTATTTTTKSSPTTKPTTPPRSYDYDDPLEAPAVKGTSSRFEKFQSYELDASSRDVSQTSKLSNGVKHKPHNEFNSMHSDWHQVLPDVEIPEGFNEIGADGPWVNPTFDNDTFEVKEGSGSAIDSSIFSRPKDHNNKDNDILLGHNHNHNHKVHHSSITPPSDDPNIYQYNAMEARNTPATKDEWNIVSNKDNPTNWESWNTPVTKDEWNIIPNKDDPTDWEDQHSGSHVDEHGNNLISNLNNRLEENENNPYNHLSYEHDHLNPGNVKRKYPCDDSDFWGTDENDISVYYQVAKQLPYHQSHKKRYFYHIIFIDQATDKRYFRNLRKDFWGYDDYERPIGMRLYESRSEESQDSEQAILWPGPVYEMLSGPCMPIAPTQASQHHNHYDKGKDWTNSLFVRVLDSDVNDQHLGGENSGFIRNERLIDNYLHNNLQPKQIPLDKHGKEGYWETSNDPSEPAVWYQFVCPGVYVKADNYTGQPLEPYNIPSRYNFPPPPNGDARRGCWIKRKRTNHDRHPYVPSVPTAYHHSRPLGHDYNKNEHHYIRNGVGEYNSNKVYGDNFDRNGGREINSNGHTEVNGNGHRQVNGNGNNFIEDHEYELVWVEYSGPGRFDPTNERPKISFEIENKNNREGFIPDQDNKIMELRGRPSSQSNKFFGLPKVWSVKRDGSLQCIMPDAIPQVSKTKSFLGRYKILNFKPETVKVKDGNIYAELTNGTYAPIGCVIGTTHMIGYWVHKNAALAMIGDDKHVGGVKYFFGYPVESHKFINMEVSGNAEDSKHSSHKYPNVWNEEVVKNNAWKPTLPLKLQTCKPTQPLDVVVGVDVRSRSERKRRRAWQIVKDFVSGLDMKKREVSVRFAHDYIDLNGPRASLYSPYVPHGESQSRRLKRSGVFTEKNELLGKIGDMESMCSTSSLIQAMSDILKVDGLALSKDQLLSDICNQNVTAAKDSQGMVKDGERARKIALLIVDGLIEDIEDSLALASEMTQKFNFELFIIGIGKAIEPIQLMSIASNNGAAVNYFSFDSNRHDPRYLEQLELFFLHKDPKKKKALKPAKTKNARHSTRLQYRHEILKLLTRVCEDL